MPIMLGADDAADDDDMGDLQASKAAEQQSDSEDSEDDSEDDSEEDSDDDDDDDDDEDDEEEEEPEKNITTESDGPTTLKGMKEVEEDKSKIKADKKKAKKIRKDKEFKKDTVDEEAKKEPTIKEADIQLLSGTDAAADTADLKADKKKAKKKSKGMEFKPEIADDEASSSTTTTTTITKDEPIGLLGPDDAAQEDDITPGTAAKENEITDDEASSSTVTTTTTTKDEPIGLFSAHNVTQDDDMTPGTSAKENESTPETQDTKVVPDLDESEQVIYEYVKECREVFAYVDKTQRGTIPLSAMPHALHCLGLCPFTCDIDAMQQELAGEENTTSEVGFAFFMATAMRIRKRERVTKRPGVVVMDTWKKLDQYMGLNGKVNLDDLKAILSQMGDQFNESEISNSFKNCRLFVDEYGMLEFPSWLKSMDPSFGDNNDDNDDGGGG